MNKKELERTKNIAHNIKLLIEKENITQKKLSEEIGISPSTMSDYMNYRSNPSHGVIQKISDYFNVPKSDIDESYKTTNIVPVTKIKNIPVISEVACGKPIFAEDNFDKTIPYSVDLLPSGNSFFVLAKGDSMDPTIKDQELVLIREQETVENGEIACVVFINSDSEATLKRVKKQGGEVYLVPDNPDYLPYKLNENENVRILGKAMFVINQL